MAGGSVDISVPGKYPIVLSDALLGKGSKESFTSIRCKLRILLRAGKHLTALQITTNQSLP
jgi:hypothetical protein